MRGQRQIQRLEEEVRRLTLAVETAKVDRDYYRAQRDRYKEMATERGQALRQILVAIESDSDDRLDAILRIARLVAGP